MVLGGRPPGRVGRRQNFDVKNPEANGFGVLSRSRPIAFRIDAHAYTP
jgi:hypothetical protein